MRDRSVLEIAVLILTLVVGITLVVTAVTVSIVKIRSPATDISAAAEPLFNAVSTLIGALVGLLVGRTRAAREFRQQAKDDDDGEDGS